MFKEAMTKEVYHNNKKIKISHLCENYFDVDLAPPLSMIGNRGVTKVILTKSGSPILKGFIFILFYFYYFLFYYFIIYLYFILFFIFYFLHLFLFYFILF